ncbi:MAG: protein kinase, partial [Anaerolineae bacterium]|nr:protein kinase [Anaerolineae bacterium]
MIGSTLGAYEIVDEIGRGGMATVYRAYQRNVDRYVAVKVIHRAILVDQVSIERFNREGRLIARLEHPHILPVYDYNGQNDPPYIVMRYLAGGTLREIMGQGRLPLREVGQLLAQVASALDYAHRQGVVHRDIKPSNILVDADGNAFLTDFGIARLVEGAEQLTGTGMALGTPGYMSPEQGMGAVIDGRADIYSLGVMLYEMLTGAMPYKAETPMGVILKHISDPVPDLVAANPDLPESLNAVVRKAMAKAPDERYGTAMELARAFNAAIGPSPQATPAQLQSYVAQTIQLAEEKRAALMAGVTSPLPAEPLPTPRGAVTPPRPTLGSQRTPRLAATEEMEPGASRPANRAVLIGGVAVVVVAALAIVALLAIRGGALPDEQSGTAVAISGTQ